MGLNVTEGRALYQEMTTLEQVLERKSDEIKQHQLHLDFYVPKVAPAISKALIYCAECLNNIGDYLHQLRLPMNELDTLLGDYLQAVPDSFLTSKAGLVNEISENSEKITSELETIQRQ